MAAWDSEVAEKLVSLQKQRESRALGDVIIAAYADLLPLARFAAACGVGGDSQKQHAVAVTAAPPPQK